jgi:hypothetical protein
MLKGTSYLQTRMPVIIYVVAVEIHRRANHHNNEAKHEGF